MASPIPEILVEINASRLIELEKDIGLKRPITLHLRQTVGILPGQGELRGDAQGHTINIYYGLNEQSHNRLAFVQTQIVRTLLHEVRHIWQNENWTVEKKSENERFSYRIRPSEVDARDFADKNVAKYRNLIRVRRSYARSRLGRLAHAEQAVRQDR